jgi:hypothetical protein
MPAATIIDGEDGAAAAIAAAAVGCCVDVDAGVIGAKEPCCWLPPALAAVVVAGL